MISGAPYLVGLAAFVMLISMSAAGLDFLFRLRAVTQFGKGAGTQPFLRDFLHLYFSGDIRGPGRPQPDLAEAVRSGTHRGRAAGGGYGSQSGFAVRSRRHRDLFQPRAGGVAARIVVPLRLRVVLYAHARGRTAVDQVRDRYWSGSPGRGLGRRGDSVVAGVPGGGFLPIHPGRDCRYGPAWPHGSRSGWIGRTWRCSKKVWHGKPLPSLRKTPKTLLPDLSCCVRLRSPGVGEPGRHAADAPPIHPADVTLRRLAELRSKDPLRVRAALHAIDLRDPAAGAASDRAAGPR